MRNTDGHKSTDSDHFIQQFLGFEFTQLCILNFLHNLLQIKSNSFPCSCALLRDCQGVVRTFGRVLAT